MTHEQGNHRPNAQNFTKHLRERHEIAEVEYNVSAREAAEKECLEWKERCLAAEFRNQTQGEKLATAYAAIAILVVTVILCMTFPQLRLLIGLLGLGVVFGSQVLPMTSRLEQYVSQDLRLGARLMQSASRQTPSPRAFRRVYRTHSS